MIYAANKIVQDLRSKLQKQIDAQFISIDSEAALRVMCQTYPNLDETDLIERIVIPLYRKFTPPKWNIKFDGKYVWLFSN